MSTPSTTDKGTEYELLVQRVFNMLHAAEGVEQINIQHNVKLAGISGVTHQIDLYWEFRIAGVYYRVAVECKNYAASVSKDRITSFKGVLDDLGGISGIYVCKSGYQKGAKIYAEAHGIQLLEVRKPTDKDWDGRMRDIHLQLHYRSKDNFKVTFVVDKEWAEQNCAVKPESFHAWTNETVIEIASDEVKDGAAKLDGDSDELLEYGDVQMIDGIENTVQKRTVFTEEHTEKYSEGSSDQSFGYIRCSLLDFIRKLPSDQVGCGLEKVYKYKDAFLVYRGFGARDDSGEPEIRLNIKGFKIVYDVNEYVDRVDIYGDNIVMAIVKNIQEQSEKTVAWDGRVWERKGLESKT